jgi:hypothetical protein
MTFSINIRPIYKLGISLILTISPFVHAQLPNIDSLSQNVKTYYLLKQQAELEEYQKLNRYTLLNLVPSISYNWIDNRVYLTVNLASLISQLDAGQQRKYKRNCIVLKNELELSKSLILLETKNRQLAFTLEKLDFEQKIYSKHKDLFSIREQEYKNNEITVEEFIKEEILILEAEKRIMDLTQKAMELYGELENISSSSITYNYSKKLIK